MSRAPMPAHSGPFPTTLCLVSIDPNQNRWRFYRISHQRTLWDEDVLVQTWGRLGTDGCSRLCFLQAGEDVQTVVAKLLRQRFQHGYRLTPAFADPEAASG